MKRTVFLGFLTILSLFPLFLYGQLSDVDIPYKKFTLTNGLTVFVHEDHKAPIVAVNIWYHVGSKNEKPGRTGFAHLFEHLMFNGSENFNDDYFQALERLGATDLNGTTNNDRTNYFQNVPKSGLDALLWLESDRMGHLLKAITQEKLDEQRGVVQNEKRQGENEPYSLAEEIIAQNTYPAGHPYSWTVIGSMEDLSAAKLEDVHEWFSKYYGPSNAVLVLAGDITMVEATEKVIKYFGDIPPGPPVARPQSSIAKMTGTKRYVAQDNVPQIKLTKVWNVPGWNSVDAVHLDLFSDLLSSGKSSRLYKRLVYDDQTATNVNCYIDMREIGSQFVIEAMVKPGKTLQEVEAAIDEELNKAMTKPVGAQEIERIKTGYLANFVRGIERIGGFGGKSDILAQNTVFAGDPEFYKKKLQYAQSVTPEALTATAKKWLSDGVFILEIHPFPPLMKLDAGADRKAMPKMETPDDAKFTKYEKRTLSNGLTVVLAHNKSVPIVNFRLLLRGGVSAEKGILSGTATMVMNMLDEGTTTKNSLGISDELQLLGAKLNTGANLDYCLVTASALKMNLDRTLDLYADVILNPSFPQKELDRLIQERVAQIKREKASPIQMGIRVLPVLLFGDMHSYGAPFSGSGYESDVQKLKVDDMFAYHKKWFKPNNATLIVVGDITADELLPKLERAFAKWKRGDVPAIDIPNVAAPEKPLIYVIDRPGSQQSILLAGSLVQKKDEDDIALETMNQILGGVFTSRINMNLREDKHWSYGSGSFVMDTRAQRPYLFYGFIQADKTTEALREMYKEVNDFRGARPATEEELTKVKQNQIFQMAGMWETGAAISQSLEDIIKYDLAPDYFDKYPGRVRMLSTEGIAGISKKALQPENMIWVVVCDFAKNGGGLKDIGYEIRMIDTDGKPVK